MIVRVADSLRTKIKAGRLGSLSLDENPYADWSARLFTADRAQYILISNTQSLYSIVTFGRGITSDHTFIKRSLDSIREFMEDDGLSFIYQQFIAPASGTVQFGKALDRRVTGSMNELTAVAKIILSGGETSPHEVGFQLNDILLSALNDGEGDGYGKPRDTFKRLASHAATGENKGPA